MKYFIILLICLFVSCNMTSKKIVDDTIVKNEENLNMTYAGPPTIIYKTHKDYFKNVPITLNESKTEVDSYPAPQDIYYNGELAYPTKLKKGYLLDNRGIGRNTVFLKYSYEEYSKLKEAPSLDGLMKSIIDKEPFTEIWDCGNRYIFKDIEIELNEIIRTRRLSKFKQIR